MLKLTWVALLALMKGLTVTAMVELYYRREEKKAKHFLEQAPDGIFLA